MKTTSMLKFTIKKIHVLLSFCLAVFSANLLFASEKVMSLGGKNGWQEFSLNDGITFGKGRFGLTSVELAKNERKPNENTDLLLNFENSMSDVVSNYTVVKNDLVQIEKSVMGKYCALSRGKGSGIELKGNEVKSIVNFIDTKDYTIIVKPVYSNPNRKKDTTNAKSIQEFMNKIKESNKDLYNEYVELRDKTYEKNGKKVKTNFLIVKKWFYEKFPEQNPFKK